MGQFFYPFADVAVLRSENTSNIMHEVDSSHFIIERGFFWCIYKKKGPGLLGT